MQWSGRFVRLGFAPCWLCVDADTESEAEDKLRLLTPLDRALDGICRGDHTRGASEEKPAPVTEPRRRRPPPPRG
jgi:hypothetical protein